MKHVFVFDPKSFHEKQPVMDGIIESIGQYFKTQEKPDFSIEISRYPRNAIELIQKNVDEAEDGDTVRVYAVGGDEILYDCLNGIVGLPNVELSAVPFHATGDFLQALGEESTDLFKDIPSLVAAPVIPTDMIDTGYSYALNTCFLGFISATVTKKREMYKALGRENSSFFLFDALMSFMVFLSTAFNKRIVAQHYNLIIDDEDYSGNYSLINIANGPFYAGNRTAAAWATPDDGWLDVALIKSADPLKTMRSMKEYSSGKKPSNCVILQAKKISVQSEEPMLIQLDGEFLQDISFSFEVIPGAVNFAAVNNLTNQNSQ